MEVSENLDLNNQINKLRLGCELYAKNSKAARILNRTFDIPNFM